MSSENPIEKQFLDEYMSGNTYSYEIFRQHNHCHNPPLTVVFREQFLQELCDMVDDVTFMDVYTRFTFIKQKIGGFVAINKPMDKSGNYIFSRGGIDYAVGQKDEKNNICDSSGHIVCHLVGKCDIFCDYSVGCLLSGTWNEFICQIPKQFINSTQKYYVEYDLIETRYETHMMRISLYQRDT